MNTAFLSVFGAAVLFASAGLATGFAADASSVSLAISRTLFGGLALILWSGPRTFARTLLSVDRTLLLTAAIAMALFQWSYFAAVHRAGVGPATLASAAAAPFFADVIAVMRGHAPVTTRMLLRTAVIALLLVILVMQAPSGIALATCSAAMYAGYAAAASSLERSHMKAGLHATTASLVIAGVFLLVVSDFDVRVFGSVREALVSAYLALVATALAYALFVSALREMTTACALLVLLVQPLVAVLGGVLLLREPLNFPLFAASVTAVLALAADGISKQLHQGGNHD